MQNLFSCLDSGLPSIYEVNDWVQHSFRLFDDRFIRIRLYAAGNQVTAISAAPDAAARLLPPP